jgi:DNA-binding CsgD family transcriptional regulator
MTFVISFRAVVAAVRQSDLQAALDFLCEAEEVTGPEPFPTELLDRLRGLVPCDFLGYNEFDIVEQRVLFREGCASARAAQEPDTVDDDVLWRACHRSPISSYHAQTGEFNAVKLSDFLSRRELHRNEYYVTMMRDWGLEHELVVGLPATLQHTKVFVLASQDRDFDERDRAVLDALRPHLSALYSAAAARRVATAITAGGAVAGELIVLSPSGAIDFETDAARELLTRYFPEEHNGRLPETVESWRRHQATRLNGSGSLPSPAEPLTVRREGTRLVIRRLGHTLLLSEEPAALTPREREVMSLLADGCSNGEIASALWIAPTTVRKHLENIYAKLGVRTRTAAVARIRRR